MGQMCIRMVGYQREERIAILGLDGAGKTTMLYKLKLGEVITTIPTIGFNVETLQYKRTRFQCWDLGRTIPGNRENRDAFLRDIDGIVFVVDSSDQERLPEAAEELKAFLALPNLARVPLLVFANKQDKPGAQSPSQITHLLDLHRICDRRWYIEGVSAPTGDGLYEGLDWLHQVCQESSS